MTLLIRPETPADVPAVQALIAAAFAPADHDGGPVVEEVLNDALRRDPDWIARWTLVAEADGEIVGQVTASYGVLEHPDPTVPDRRSSRWVRLPVLPVPAADRDRQRVAASGDRGAPMPRANRPSCCWARPISTAGSVSWRPRIGGYRRAGPRLGQVLSGPAACRTRRPDGRAVPLRGAVRGAVVGPSSVHRPGLH